MSLTPTKRSLCNKMNGDFNSIVGPVNSNIGAIAGNLNSVNSQINSLKSGGFSSISQINSAVADIDYVVGQNIPGDDESAIEEVIDTIQTCSYLNTDEIKSNPISVLKGLYDSNINKVYDICDDYISAVPEFGAGKTIDQLRKTYSDSVSSAMQKADRLIECMNSTCGSEFSSQITQYTNIINNLFSRLKMVSNPISSDYLKLDIQSIYNSLDLDVDQIFKMDTVANSVLSSRNRVTNSITNAISKAKSMKILNLF